CSPRASCCAVMAVGVAGSVGRSPRCRGGGGGARNCWTLPANSASNAMRKKQTRASQSRAKRPMRILLRKLGGEEAQRVLRGDGADLRVLESLGPQRLREQRQAGHVEGRLHRAVEVAAQREMFDADHVR